MTATLVDRCQSCGSQLLEQVLYLGYGAPANLMIPTDCWLEGTEMYPLALLRCPECTLVQLSEMVDPLSLFPRRYPYSSGNSGELRDHFYQLAETTASYSHLTPEDLVVDIGANDGTLLRAFQTRAGVRTVGIEPTDQVQRIDGPVYQDFFGFDVVQRCISEHGFAKVITACNVLAHVADIHRTLDAIKLLLADGGTLIAENHDLASIVDGGQWDTVYHEHLRYYDPYSFQRLLEPHGLYVWRVDQISTHGGSFRAWVSKSWSGSRTQERRNYDFERLRQTAAKGRAWLRSALSAQRMGGERIVGIGATARASTIIGYCGLERDDIECVYEVPGSDKIDRRIAGTAIPVRSEEALFRPPQPHLAVLFSWHLMDRIVPKLRQNGYRGVIVVPLPELKFLRP